MKNQALYNKIMKNVSKGLNRTLNEGFREWKEKAAPKLDETLWNQNAQKLVSYIAELANDKEVKKMSVIIKNSDRWQDVIPFDSDKLKELSSESIARQILIAINRLLDEHGNLINYMKACAIKLIIPNSSYFAKYIAEMEDPAYRGCVKGFQNLKFEKGLTYSDQNVYTVLYIPLYHYIMEDVEAMKEFFE